MAEITLPPEITDLEDFTESINMMVYGDAGVGKTVFASKDDRVLIFATEHGTISAARQYRKTKAKNVVKIVDCVGDWDKFESMTDWVVEQCEKGTLPFDWVVIDTGTTLQQLILKDIVSKAAEKSGSRSLDKPQIEEYGEQQAKFRRFVELYNDLPVNFLMTAHAMQTEDHEGNEYVAPAFHGKGNQMSNWVCAQMHVYGFMTVGTAISARTKNEIKVRRIRWQASENIRAKDRFDALGEKTSNKTLKQIRHMIEESAGVDEDQPATEK